MPRNLEFRDLGPIRHYFWLGWPTRRIAKAIGVDRSVIQRILRERGLPIHTHRSANIFLAGEKSLAEKHAQTAAARAARWPRSLQVGNGQSERPFPDC
jgi:hypothetical protein